MLLVLRNFSNIMKRGIVLRGGTYWGHTSDTSIFPFTCIMIILILVAENTTGPTYRIL